MPFSLNVSGADDGYGNLWSGTVAVDASAGGGNAPDGTPPSFNAIVVSGGTGSATQTLTHAVTTTLRGQASGVIRYTASIQVNPGSLYEFTLAGYPTSVTAGNGFPGGVTVTAYDGYRNRKTNYSGTVTWSSTDGTPYPATLPTDNGSGWSSGQKIFSGSSFILYNTPTQTITVQDGSASETSSSITVTTAGINGFNLNCGTTQIAGAPFSLSVTGAQDSYGNSWSGTVSVSATSGGGNSPNGVSPTFNNIGVSNGSGQANQILVRAESGVVLQGQAASVTRTVTGITVSPSVLASLKIRDTGGGGGSEVVTHAMNVGETLTLYSAGYDIYGNYRGDGNTNWTSQGLTPPVNAASISSISFIPTVPGSGTITSTDPSSAISDHTGTITVNPGVVTHFEIDVINTQVVGDPFPMTITALDVNNNRATGFTGTVEISDLTGTISRTQSGNFVDGVWSGLVTVFQEYTNNVITVTETGGSPPVPTGTSNPFNVIPAPGVRIVGFEAVQSDTITSLQTVTIDQSRDWFLKMAIENMGSVAVRLDSVRLQFIVGGAARTDYVVSLPSTFLGSGSDMLAGGVTDSLLIRVDVTGHDAGAATVQGFVYFWNTHTSRPLPPDNALVMLTVQTPAQLGITDIRLSQDEITRGQEEDWTVTMTVRNAGGSEVTVDSSAASTTVSFSLGTGWQMGRPSAFHGGGWVLSAGETDSLIYTVRRTGDGQAGSCNVHGRIGGVEDNTGRSVADDTQGGGWAEVLVENPAALRVMNVENLAMNAPRVNTGQSFSLRVTVMNDGGDGVHDAQVQLRSDGISNFPFSTSLPAISGGETKSVEISGEASFILDALEVLTADVEGYADNTNRLLLSTGAVDDTARVVIQNPAILLVDRVAASVSRVVGGQTDPWTVRVAVVNDGQAALVLNTPQAGDITFWVGGILQSDYQVTPPTSLRGGGLTLAGGAEDTLVYTVTSTGRLGGTVQVRAQIDGEDKNTAGSLSDEGTTSVVVQSEPAFRIISTRIATRNRTAAGDGYVNTGQGFGVVVVVENGLGATVRDVRVRLESDGASLASPVTGLISRLTPFTWDSVQFAITADGAENLSGETFTATITQATMGGSGLPVPVGPALDSTAAAIIQSPASLSLSLALSNPAGYFSAGQIFALRATLVNEGTGGVDGLGRVRVDLPVNYALLSSSDTSSIAMGAPAEWSIQAPDEDQGPDPIYVSLERIPKELNTGNNATVDETTVSVDVTTLLSWLTTGLEIVSPAGAVDGIVSSEQSFVVKAIVQWHNVKNITAQIDLPAGYETADNVEISVISPEVFWTVTAPDLPAGGGSIWVFTQGVDSLQEEVEIVADPVSMPVSTVSRADLSLDLSIVNPPDAVDGIVSLGQDFVVEARVTNNGQAGLVGATRVTLSLPQGYSTSDSLTQTLAAGVTQWTVRAPSHTTGVVDNIVAVLTTVPQDENRNRTADVGQGSDGVAVTTEGQWLSVSSVEPLPSWMGSSVVPGQRRIGLMVLELINQGTAGANQIIIHSMQFTVEDRHGNEIPPSAVLSRIYVLDMDDTTQVYGRSTPTSENPVTIQFTQEEMAIAVGTAHRVAVFGDVVASNQQVYFQLNLANGGFVDATDEGSGNEVPVNDVLGETIVDMRSVPKRIFQSGVQTVLLNCPNPFGGPGEEETTIIYYLEDDTDVSFQIYTLLGEPVWSRVHTSADPQGAAGMHSGDVVWRGVNDKGLRVLNGVYLLIMKTGDGKVAKTKIAVVK